jgi:hypothetical protein
MCGTCQPAVSLTKLKRWQAKNLDLDELKKDLHCPTHGEKFFRQQVLVRAR